MAKPLKTEAAELNSPQEELELPTPPEAAEKALPSAEYLALTRGKTKQLLEEGKV